MEELDDLFKFLNLYGESLEKLGDEGKKIQQALRQVMLLTAQKKKLPKDTLRNLDELIKKVSGEMELKQNKDNISWEWGKSAFSKLTPSAKFVRLAESVLLNGELSRIKHCEGENCPFIFFDHSKNKSRKWCEMNHCGMLLKSKRYYERHRKKT